LSQIITDWISTDCNGGLDTHINPSTFRHIIANALNLKLDPTHSWKLHIYSQLRGNFTSSILSGKTVDVHTLFDAVSVSKFACYSSKYIWEIPKRSATLPKKSPEEPNVKINMADVSL